MSKNRDLLIRHLSERTGVDATAIVDALYSTGALDDVLARRHVVISEFMRLYVTTDKSERSIMEDVGYAFGLSRIRVLQMVSTTYPRT